MGSWIANQWQYNTVKIHSQIGGIGTGFFVYIETQADRAGEVFLITNKHLIHPDVQQLATVTQIECDIHIENTPGAVGCQTTTIPLYDKNHNPMLFAHTTPYVDVCAILVTGAYYSVKNRKTSLVDIVRITTDRFRKKNAVSWGDEVFIIGYPDGISQGTNELPLIRHGIICSQIGDPIRYTLSAQYQDVVCTAFFIDSAIYGGCSGSVVVLKPAIGRYVEERFNMNPAEPDVLGIVSHSLNITGLQHSGELAHIGLAWEADNIMSCIVDYYNTTRNWTYEDLLRIYYNNRGMVFPGP
jgi:hypothetical protein